MKMLPTRDLINRIFNVAVRNPQTGCLEMSLPYQQFRIFTNQEMPRTTAHRAVFAYFHGYWPKAVCHECDNPRCVNKKHLFPGNIAINNEDSKQKGRRAYGSRIGTSKLTEKEVAEIRKRYKGFNLREWAKAHGITYSNAYRLIWSNNTNLLSNHDLKELRSGYLNRVTKTDLAREFGVSQTLIGDIISRKWWKDETKFDNNLHARKNLPGNDESDKGHHSEGQPSHGSVKKRRSSKNNKTGIS